MTISFQHRQSAHCESGVVSALLSHHGLPLSEAMAFGIGAALSFAYIPIIKLGGMPLIAYRMPPGHIIRGVKKRLAIPMVQQKFRRPRDGMAELDKLLVEGRIVGLQTCVYWLPYFPDAMRFHFNAHNLIVYGREGDDYLISDPVFEHVTRCPAADLEKARFAKGALAANGLLYYPQQLPEQINYEQVIGSAVRANFRTMMKAPLPMIGVRGIRYLANNIVKYARTKPEQLPLYLGHIVRMQEEIGTGGAGFRFIYAAFLQESSRILSNPALAEASRMLTDAGDEWRMFALRASKMCRNRSPMDVGELRDILHRCSDREAEVWRALKNW